MLYALLTSMILNFSISPDINHENENYYTKNKIDNYDIITISQSGSLFYSVTNQIIDSAKNLNTNVTFIGRANVGLESTMSSTNEVKLTTLDDYLYSISIKTIDSEVVDLFYDNESSRTIKNGQIVVSKITAERYNLETGDFVNLVGLDNEIITLEVGKIVEDAKIGWFEGVNKEVGFRLGITRNIQAIVWDTQINENFLIELYKNINYKKVRLSFREDKPNKNWVLPTVLVKEWFGDFQIKERDGVWITTEPSWRENNIEQKRMPILGLTVCHRLMWEPLEGALNQIIEEGLEDTLSVEEFRTSGGCYAPRRINRFDAGGSISRHAWGIAIDINTKSGYHPRVVEIFNEWGFAWAQTRNTLTGWYGAGTALCLLC